ncbi:MAG: hypothetical protein ABR981_00635 [Candidatus Micrarchaeaceae archaeon]|jgi:threonyl-tRNA synthetase
MATTLTNNKTQTQVDDEQTLSLNIKRYDLEKFKLLLRVTTFEVNAAKIVLSGLSRSSYPTENFDKLIEALKRATSD